MRTSEPNTIANPDLHGGMKDSADGLLAKEDGGRKSGCIMSLDRKRKLKEYYEKRAEKKKNMK